VSPLQCSDDFDGCGSDGLRSLLFVPVVADHCYLLQVGGFQGATGHLVISSECLETVCPGDEPTCGHGGRWFRADARPGCLCWTAGGQTVPFCWDTQGAAGCAAEPLAASPSPCAPPCPADINGDSTVNVVDLLALLGAWNQAGGPADINGDGIVNIAD